jgi:hypothetical protein
VIFERKIHAEVKKYLDTDDIIVIHGARQTGKTTLLRLLMQDLKPDETCFMDLEDGRLLELCEQGPAGIIDYLKQKGMLKEKRRCFLLVDEIQYLSNPSSFMKLIHDHHREMKLIVSGSSSFDIKSKFKDSLTGRTVNFELYPLDFEEFLLFKGKRVQIKEKITSPLIIGELKQLYKEYVMSGGYPRIVLADAAERRERYLQQIVDTYIKKDIRDLARIRNIDKFNKLLQVLASQSGQLLNFTELANTVHLSRQTVEEYLFILENTYIIKLLTPFSQNVRSELFKTPKIFFYDSGLLHLLRFKMLPLEMEGSAFETSIFSEFAKNIGVEYFHYWRTQDKKEIDFIVVRNRRPIPVEVKLNARRLKHTAMRYFSHHYKPPVNLCIRLEGEVPSGSFAGESVKSIYPWEYPLYLFCTRRA